MPSISAVYVLYAMKTCFYTYATIAAAVFAYIDMPYHISCILKHVFAYWYPKFMGIM